MKPTPEQRAVIEHDAGHALVSAVAGSGKTATLVERIAYRMARGEPAMDTVVLQFNRDAKEGFIRRLAQRLGDQPAPGVFTFHGLANRMVDHLQRIGVLPAATLETREGPRIALATQALRESWRSYHGQSAAPPTERQREGFLQFLSVVNAGFDSAAAVFDRLGLPKDCTPYVGAVRQFNALRTKRSWRFFDDLLIDAVTACVQNPDLWALFNHKRQVLVDEFQDVNAIQYAMVQGLTSGGASLIAVGDDDQSIYGWRGSSIDFIRRRVPEDYFPTTFTLSRTFRFGPSVALAANNLITHNADRTDKIVVSAPGTPATRVVRMPLSGIGPSGLIDHLAPRWNEGTLREAAMLCRNFSQAIPFEMELASAGIPFHTYGREPLLWIDEVAAMIGAMCLAGERWPVPMDEQVRFFRAMLKAPTLYLPAAALDTLSEAMCEAYQAGKRDFTEPLRRAAGAPENERKRRAMIERADAMQIMANPSIGALPANQVIEHWIQSVGLRDHLARTAASATERTEALAVVNAIIAMAKRAGSVDALVEQLEPLASGVATKPPDGDHFAITSVHRAKGCEWPTVYLAGWSAGAFPARDGSDLEEERRLAYVALTRAQEELVIFHPRDSAIEALASDPALGIEDAPSERNASPFLFEADLGAAGAVARAIEAGANERIHTRRHRLASRYLAAAGITQVAATGDPGEPERPPSGNRLARSLDAKVGMRLEFPGFGAVEVIEVLPPPVLKVRTADGTVRMIVAEPDALPILDSA